MSVLDIETANKLNEYSKSKQDLVTRKKNLAHNDAKNNFFLEVIELNNNNTLTVTALTNLLIQYSTQDNIHKLFHRARSGGPSPDSHAAQLIQALYAELGVDISDEMLQEIVDGKLTKNSALAAEIEALTFPAWEEDFNNGSKHIKREIEVKLDLPPNGTTLAASIKTRLKKQENVNWGKQKKQAEYAKQLKQYLLGIVELSPKATIQLIEMLYLLYTENDEQFVTALSDIATEIENKKTRASTHERTLLHAIFNADNDLAYIFVKEKPERFFNLNSGLQKNVKKSLKEKEKEKEKTEILEGIEQTAEQKLYCINNNEEKLKFILEPLVITRYQGEERLTNFIFKNVKHHLSLVNKEQALKLIEDYLATTNHVYKRKFFRTLHQNIKTQGFSFEILKNTINDRELDLDKLFEKWSGQSRSNAMACLRELYILARFADPKTVPTVLLKEHFLASYPAVKERQDFIKNKIKQELADPNSLEKTELSKIIKHEITNLRTATRICYPEIESKNPAAEIASAEAIYQRYVLNKAIKKAEDIAVKRKQLAEQAIKLEQKIKQCDTRVSYFEVNIKNFNDIENLKNDLIKEAQALQKEIDALNKAYSKNQLRFDPQGSLLGKVTLTSQDYEAIVREITNKKQEISKPKKRLERLLGVKKGSLTETTYCSIDITAHNSLKEHFKLWAGEENHVKIQQLINFDGRASIIPLQYEMEMYVNLALRAFRKLIESNKTLFKDSLNVTEKDWKKIQRNVLNQVSENVRNAFITALSEIKTVNQGTVSELNQKLDAARKPLRKAAQNIVINNLLKNVKPNKAAKVAQQLSENLNKELFAHTTATGNDFISFNHRNQISKRITGSEGTAHNKRSLSPENKDPQAFRLVRRTHVVMKENKIDIKSIRLQAEARVPSIALTEPEHKDAVKDVANKLAQNAKTLNRSLGSNSQQNFVYNLLTSLYPKAVDSTLTGYQRKSAARILKGSHVYNHKQIKRSATPQLWLIQNIPVNQHGNELSLKAKDEATQEATLMSEIAVLATLSQNINLLPKRSQKIVQETYSIQLKRYNQFLRSKITGDEYFSQSRPGKKAIAALQKLRTKKLFPRFQIEGTVNLTQLITVALYKLFINGEHYKLQFGMIIQTFSVYLESATMYGCKSANERYQAVARRNELLLSIGRRTEEQQSCSEQAFVTTLKGYLKGTQTFTEVQTTLDRAYNEHNLESPDVSPLDQGAASKLQHSENNEPGIVDEFNTNYGETNTLSNLHSKNASKGQAHKDPCKKYKKRLDNYKPPEKALSWFEEIKKKITEIISANCKKVKHLFLNELSTNKKEKYGKRKRSKSQNSFNKGKVSKEQLDTLSNSIGKKKPNQNALFKLKSTVAQVNTESYGGSLGSKKKPIISLLPNEN